MSVILPLGLAKKKKKRLNLLYREIFGHESFMQTQLKKRTPVYTQTFILVPFPL